MRLIEDEDGAPLPDKLQFESVIWLQVYNLLRDGNNTARAVELTDEAMRLVAPLTLPNFRFSYETTSQQG